MDPPFSKERRDKRNSLRLSILDRFGLMCQLVLSWNYKAKVILQALEPLPIKQDQEKEVFSTLIEGFACVISERPRQNMRSAKKINMLVLCYDSY
jgi:hypothetical protein